MNNEHRAAARERAVRAPSRAARPSQRRNAADPAAARVAVVRGRPQVRAAEGGTGLAFSGLASATDTPYEMWDWLGPYTEIVSAGAFGKTLAQVDLDVPLVLQHVDLRRLARTTIPAGELGHLMLREDDTGLVADALLDPADPDVAYIAPKIASGLVTEMSFRFMITAGQWSPDWMEYHIEEVDIHRGDVAICGYGANPATSAEILPTLAELAASASEDDARLLYDQLAVRFPSARAARRVFAVSDADLT